MSIIRRFNPEPNKRYKILTSPIHEGYSWMMKDINADFYLVTGSTLKRWDFHTRSLPPNHYLFNLPIENLPPDIKYDFILCGNRLQCYNIFKDISLRFNIPLIVLDHTEPPQNLTKYHWSEIKKWKGDLNIFITEHNRKTWEGSDKDVVIRHGIDTNLFKGWKYSLCDLKVISVVNHYRSRNVFTGFDDWDIISKHVNCNVVGENPDGLGKSINNVNDLVSYINKHCVFLNTSTYSPVPLSLIEAMSCGIPVVSSKKQEIPNIINHGQNGFMYDSPLEAVEYCKELMKNPDLASMIGESGRQTIIDKFNIKRFTNQWNEELNKLYNRN